MTVTPGRDGTPPTVDVARPSGATGAVRVATEGGDTYVYPDEALPYLATGRLDRQLFDVTQLVAQGFDDARTSALPLIVTRTTGSATLRTSTALPGAETTLDLPSVRGQAIRAGIGERAEPGRVRVHPCHRRAAQRRWRHPDRHAGLRRQVTAVGVGARLAPTPTRTEGRHDREPENPAP
ncbi:hypothetical protein ACGFIE_28935 [Micromonospora sp. NPDC049275]|uniref:hypothetical protein n=1 Tax=Micromonospora sp. NPDC049275 TaxID=3364268 RepID=UPI0037194781